MDEQQLKDRQRAYRMTFSGPSGGAVLLDIMTAGFACQPTTIAGPNGVDVYATFEAQGMRKLWLHIERQMELTPAELTMLHRGNHLEEPK